MKKRYNETKAKVLRANVGVLGPFRTFVVSGDHLWEVSYIGMGTTWVYQTVTGKWEKGKI